MKILGYINDNNITTAVIITSNVKKEAIDHLEVGNTILVQSKSSAVMVLEWLFHCIADDGNTIKMENLTNDVLDALAMMVTEVCRTIEVLNEDDLDKELHARLTSKHFTHVIKPRK